MREERTLKRIAWAAAAIVIVLSGAVLLPKLVFAGSGDAPINFVAVAGARPVIASLSWDPAPDSAPDHYRVYVGTSEAGVYLTPIDVSDTSFNYTTGLGGMRYYFRVVAVDSLGNESDAALSGPVTAPWAQTPHTNATGATTCALCHTPHYAGRFLNRPELSTTSSEPTALCVPCHDGRVASAANITSGTANSFSLASGHVLPGADSSSLVQNCSSCHFAHAKEESSPMLPARHINESDVDADGSGWCTSCHDSKDSWYGAGYPSTEAPSRDASGYPVSGTWPQPDTYNGPTNAHRLIVATTQTTTAGTVVKRSKGDCLYCHAAHKGPNKYDGLVAQFRPTTASTLVNDQASGAYAAACLTCHGSKLPSGFTSATVGANIEKFVATDTPSAGHRIVTPGGTLPVGAPLPCYDCHNPHGSTRNNQALISDERGRAMETSSAVGVRHFCFSCHTTADYVTGWDSTSTVFAQVASDTVEGIERAGGVLHLPPLSAHNEADTTSCYSCHGSNYATGGNNVHAPSITGGYDAASHTGTPTAQTFLIGGQTYPALACTECHAVELGAEHFKSTSQGNERACGLCHPSPRNTLVPDWDRTTCAQGGCHTISSAAPLHASIDASHTRLPANAQCATSGCHTLDLAGIHSSASPTTAGVTRTSCQVCHSVATIPASRNCLACHPEKVDGSGNVVGHGYTAARHVSAIATMTFSGTLPYNYDVGSGGTMTFAVGCTQCHLANIYDEHQKYSATASQGCGLCHSSPRNTFTTWGKGCQQGGCHTTIHTQMNARHAPASNSCGKWGSDCHGGSLNSWGTMDAAAAHNDYWYWQIGGWNNYVHVPQPAYGCATCHTNATTVPSVTTCDQCHIEGENWVHP